MWYSTRRCTHVRSPKNAKELLYCELDMNLQTRISFSLCLLVNLLFRMVCAFIWLGSGICALCPHLNRSSTAWSNIRYVIYVYMMHEVLLSIIQWSGRRHSIQYSIGPSLSLFSLGSWPLVPRHVKSRHRRCAYGSRYFVALVFMSYTPYTLGFDRHSCAWLCFTVMNFSAIFLVPGECWILCALDSTFFLPRFCFGASPPTKIFETWFKSSQSCIRCMRRVRICIEQSTSGVPTTVPGVVVAWTLLG